MCGRTLLRGERAQVYVGGGARHSVCELCTSRALHGGWIREGTLPQFDEATTRPDRRRSLFGRLRPRREPLSRQDEWDEAPPEFDDDPLDPADLRDPAAAGDSGEAAALGEPGAPAPVAPGRRRLHGRTPPPVPAASSRAPRPAGDGRHTRHVRAVPTSVEHKIATAVEVFNASEHPRTVAGIARSLGVPEASVLPVAGAPSVVNVVVAWELCWYRYELDLSDDDPQVQKAAQGYELSELAPEERCANAAADEAGRLSL